MSRMTKAERERVLADYLAASGAGFRPRRPHSALIVASARQGRPSPFKGLKRGPSGRRDHTLKNPNWVGGRGKAIKGVPWYYEAPIEEARAAFASQGTKRSRRMDKARKNKRLVTSYAYVLHPERYDYPGVDDGRGTRLERRKAKGKRNPYR